MGKQIPVQLLLDESEYRRIERCARQRQMSVAQWMRQQAIRCAQADAPTATAEAKLQAIQSAAAHNFPTGDIGELLAEIEGGRVAD